MPERRQGPLHGEQESEKWFVTQIPYETMVISGKGYLSTEVVKLLSKFFSAISYTRQDPKCFN
jgi:hypothetical protein